MLKSALQLQPRKNQKLHKHIYGNKLKYSLNESYHFNCISVSLLPSLTIRENTSH
jgi:hypothetical protein